MNHRKKSRRMNKHGPRKTLVLGLLWFLLIILICHTIYSLSHPSNINTSQALPPKAAIVDQLSLFQPNQSFIQTATDFLETAGFSVDYYKSEEVTVEFYRNLPTHNYDLIILRVHSALRADMGPPVALFTSEPYSKTKHVQEQLTEQVVRVTFYESEDSEGSLYFGIRPEFVKQSMKGSFQNTRIIMMGCNGLTDPYMAEAFIEKGAGVYISWSNSVLASHTDLATLYLLRHFVVERRTLRGAIRETFKEVGFDPSYGSLLIYYPFEAGNCTIQTSRET